MHRSHKSDNCTDHTNHWAHVSIDTPSTRVRTRKAWGRPFYSVRRQYVSSRQQAMCPYCVCCDCVQYLTAILLVVCSTVLNGSTYQADALSVCFTRYVVTVHNTLGRLYCCTDINALQNRRGKRKKKRKKKWRLQKQRDEAALVAGVYSMVGGVSRVPRK